MKWGSDFFSFVIYIPSHYIILNAEESANLVVIKLAACADLHHLGLFLQGKQADAPQEALQVLDIVLRELPTTRYYLVLPFAYMFTTLLPLSKFDM